jgi:branched-chain amino acid transport system ATP-binding protein
MSDVLLSIRDLHVSYGKVQAVNGVSIEVPRGEIVTVIGANGAGKTTLLNAAMGILPARGSITFEGKDILRRPVEDRVGSGMTLVPERRELFASMPVEDNLLLGGFLVTSSERAEQIEKVYARFPRLKERRRQLAGTLSGGERQMLAMGRALMAKPRLLMLDEPSLGLAPLIVADIFSIVKDLRSAGVSILLIEQNARAALRLADHAYVMELGEITMSGKASDLASNPKIVETYLGIAAH